MTTKGEVESFLREMREKIKIFDIAFRPRDKNLEAIAELDIYPLDRITYLNKLTSENYYRGPTDDTLDTSKPSYYEFGIIINNIEVYIKISLGIDNKRVDCMSFHKAEKTITYPLK
ncbi:toxin [Flavobacterium cupreum]|uniref:Toxin n=1 Tax=Flavobacterium cupreum TaxID=2133766 RepID=A0A434A4Y4_9FLAO|nr:toxin [Flavobacterium cupreum]RUT69450.1 toxin [Flavobacterium cupreum]